MPRALAAALVASCLAATALACASRDARAYTPLYSAPHPPPAATGWVNVHTGMSFADSLTLDQTSILLEGSGAPGMVLGVGAHWRTTRIDLGAMFESTSSFYFKVIQKEFATGGQFRAAANLRWRYIEDAWGALFMRLTPGLMVFRHADPVRNQVASLNGSSLGGVDTHTIGFSLGFDFGVILYLTDSLALTVDLDIVSSTSTVDTSGGQVDYGLVRGLFTAGFEWRM